ncbi:MAG: HEPN domain-containing protein [Thermoguttaceae bacterium]
MNTGELVTFWLESADYDLDTAKALLKTKRYVYVGFMCHLTIEKALKAVVMRDTQTMPPKIHNLIQLARMSDIFDKLTEEQKSFLYELTPLHIEARYQTYKDVVASTMNRKRSQLLLQKTEELLCWIKQQF